MEYRALRAFGWGHDQYLDTPTEATAWLLHIHQLAEAHEAEQQRRQQEG